MHDQIHEFDIHECVVIFQLQFIEVWTKYKAEETFQIKSSSV